MERLKKRWDEEFPEKTHYTAKGLGSNKSRFKKKRKRKQDSQNPPQAIKKPNIKEKIKWVNEKKVKLVLLDEQARNRGIGFMGRLKRAWDECYPEFRHLNM